MPNFLTSRSSYEDHSVKDDGKSDMEQAQPSILFGWACSI